MNTEVRSQASPAGPALPVITGAARKISKELKTKSRTTAGKKRASVAKKLALKYKAAPKTGSAAKAKPSRKKLDALAGAATEASGVESVVAVEAVVAEPLVSIPDPAEQSVPMTCESAPEPAELLVGEGITEPAALAEIPALPDGLFASIEAIAPIVHPLAVESNLDDMELEADSVTLRSDDALVLEEPASLVAKEKPLAPIIRFLRILSSFVTEKWNWAQHKFKSHQVRKRLRVCETVSLGEKRFVAVIQVDGEQFLVGGSSSSVSTLAHLEPARQFADVFQRHCEQDLSRA